MQALADLAKKRNFEVEMKKIDDSVFEHVSQTQTKRLLEVISAGGSSVATRIGSAEQTFQATHEKGAAVVHAAQGIAQAIATKNPKNLAVKTVAAIQTVKAVTAAAVQDFDPRDALPPAWISVNFFLILFAYILYHSYFAGQ